MCFILFGECKVYVFVVIGNNYVYNGFFVIVCMCLEGFI